MAFHSGNPVSVGVHFSLGLTVEPLDQEGRDLFLLQNDVALLSNTQSSPPITCFPEKNISQLI